MPDSYYDTYNMIREIKDTEKMMQFDPLQTMIDQQKPKRQLSAASTTQ